MISLFISTPALTFTSFNQILHDKNSSIRLCGDLPYSRVRRDCTNLKGMDFKECLEREKTEPMLVEQDTNEYLCVNSETSKGAEILETFLINSRQDNGCMVKNVEALYGDILHKDSIKKLLKAYEDTIGKPIKLSYGIDTKNAIAFLLIDFNNVEIPGYTKNTLELSWSVFNEKGPCQPWNVSLIHNKLQKELTNITLIKGMKKKFDPLEGTRQLAGDNVFDGDRFKQPFVNDFQSSGSLRIPASKK